MPQCSRRQFLRWVLGGACLTSIGWDPSPGWAGMPQSALNAGSSPATGSVKEVKFYRKLEARRVECEICPRHCRIEAGKRGYCGNKENREGRYYALAYNQVCAAHIDPIEKKPLFHFRPATNAFSVAVAGCNLSCKFCQNWQISQFPPEQVEHQDLTPDQAAVIARNNQCPTIAFTYSEPTAYYTYMYDVAQTARAQGIDSVMISNGFINDRPLRELCRQLSAVKIDLKSFSKSFYRTYCSAELRPVLDTLERLKEMGIWFEIVVLLIPTLNDDPGELQRMCAWIKSNLGSDVPIHFSRFHPMYQIQNLPPTPVQTLEMARDTALQAGLHYAYLGNVPGHQGENTYCPSCRQLLIRRTGYLIRDNFIEKGSCRFCHYPIPGRWA